MKSVSQFALGLAVVALCACGGGAKDGDTTPAESELEATPVAADAEAAAPGAGEAAVEGAETAEAEQPAAEAPVCDSLCNAVLTCAIEMSGKQPTDDEQQQFLGQCKGKCSEVPPEELEGEAACVRENEGNCAGLFPCLDNVGSEKESQ